MMTPAEISAYLAHHRDWAAYTLVCAVETPAAAASWQGAKAARKTGGV